MNIYFWLIPMLTILGCWGTVRLTGYLLLHPVHPRSFLVFKVQGLLHQYRQPLIMGLADRIQAAFLQFDGLETRLTDPSNFSKLKPVIETHIDDFLRNKLKEQMPMISMFIGDKTIATLKTIFIAEIEALFPRVIGEYAGNLKKDLPVGQLIRERLEAIPPATLQSHLEPLIQPAVSKLALLGLLTGTVIAGIQVLVYIALV